MRRSLFGCAVRCSGLYLFEKMLAFLREAVDFVDSLRSRSDGQGPVEEEKQAEARGA